MTQEEASSDVQVEKHQNSNGESELPKFISSGGSDQSGLLSLLASKNRDFLLSPTGSQVQINDLQGKIVAIYFSANWYPPCREFTRVLSNTYEHLRSSNPGFEVVFVSSDEDQDAFDEYFSAMPWLAVPFSDLGSKKALNQRFDIEAIPSLIVLQPDGCKEDSTILDGVDVVYRYGSEAYPFTRERMEELVEKEKKKHENQTLEELLANSGRDHLIRHGLPNQVPVTSLMGKTVGLYFSAQWCLPGVKFTPKLASIYDKINTESLALNGDNGFEIVFVSSDHDQATFDSYFQTMPWLAIPYNDQNIKDLVRHFDVRGIPCLVILGPDGKTVTKNGRNLVNMYEERAYPFTDERIRQLERQADEEAKDLPMWKVHAGHGHGLRLVLGGAFICCECDEQGSRWVYQCIGCGYEVHPKCVRAVEDD